jgi:hypothetical protein
MGLEPAMSFGGRHVPEEFGGSGLGPFASFMLRVTQASVATAVLVTVASWAMLFNTAPAWISLIFEPLSLFLLPGLAVSVSMAGPHDLNPNVVVAASVVIYFVCFLAALEYRAYRRRHTPRG